jgi:hypothetical protein
MPCRPIRSLTGEDVGALTASATDWAQANRGAGAGPGWVRTTSESGGPLLGTSGRDG